MSEELDQFTIEEITNEIFDFITPSIKEAISLALTREGRILTKLKQENTRSTFLPLNAFEVASVKPDPTKRLEIPDGGLTGLYLIVQPSGAKSWAVRYRHAAKPRKMTLGPYPTLSLDSARTRARSALKEAADGRDPALRKQRPWKIA